MSLTTILDQFLDETPEMGMKVTLATVTNGGVTVTTIDPRVAGGGARTASLESRGFFLWIPEAPAADQIRVIDTLTVAATATTTITVLGANFSAPQTNIAGYIVTDEPATILRTANDALNLEWYETTTVLSPEITDGDVQTAGVTNWTDSNATSSKVTTAANVPYDLAQSLRVLNSAGNGNTSSGLVRIPRGKTLYVWAVARADVGTAKLLITDASSTTIDSIETTQEDWMFLWKQITPGSTVEEIKFKPGGVGASDDSYWGGFGFIRPGNRNIRLPSWITKRVQLLGISRATFSVTGDESGVSLADSRQLHRLIEGTDFRIVTAAKGANPFSIELLKDDLWQYPLFLTAQRPFGSTETLSAPTDTTDCSEDLLVQRIRHLYGKRHESLARHLNPAIEAADQLREMEATDIPQQEFKVWTGYSF